MKMNDRGVRNWLCRIGLVPSVTTLFIWGLVFSYAFARNAVVKNLIDFLVEYLGLRYAAVLVILIEGMSGVFEVVVAHVTEDQQSGRFIVITFCAASYPLGLMLIWNADGALYLYQTIFATVLIALGEAGIKISSDFHSYQLGEKIKNMPPENERDKEYMKELERIQFPLQMELTSDLPERKHSFMRGFITTRVGVRQLKSKVIDRGGKSIIVTELHKPLNLWNASAKIIGIVIGVFFSGYYVSAWETKFRVSSLVMGHAYLGFLCGIFWYYPEERPTGSPLSTIYRVFKAAFKKRGVVYPSSAEGYYSSNGNVEASNDSENPFYIRENGSSNGKNEDPNDLEEVDPEVHLKPRHPSFLLPLDKAAIKINNNQIEERQEEVCTVQQVRDVKSLFFIMPLGLTFFAYSLVSASGNTYFFQQATNLDSKVGLWDVPVIVFLVLHNFVAYVVRFIQRRKQLVGPIWSMAVGMFLSVLCCISAGAVERYRLSMAIGKAYKDVIRVSIMILTPQFVLLGLMKGFAEDGLRTFVQDRVPESMRKFVDPSIEMLLGIEKLFSIPCAFIFHWWIKDSINNSHLDRYFLMLALLSLVFFGIYVCYAKFMLPKLSKFEGTDANEEGNVRTMREFKEVLEEIVEEEEEEVLAEYEEEILEVFLS
ncbi:hypothetical protein QN277_025200 [Acacia crassicarpa]|uniref:Uncharacterized protein n=1 Tax=Acacia crassicarpa TaxID=499986 RepID=A0AAE1JHQ8_9FABA|nr:hypothetical protein QN277_025200 [Acacia crassicarpa]